MIEGSASNCLEVHPGGAPDHPSEDNPGTVELPSSLPIGKFGTPERIHNAKSFGLLNKSFQLDFVDVGLMPAIEGEVHSKLDSFSMKRWLRRSVLGLFALENR